MKKETIQKKAWRKPEVKDLDIDKTASGSIFSTAEYTASGPVS